MANTPRMRVKVPKGIKVGDVIEVKTIITHKMETGLRKDRKTGKVVPRDIIKSFVAKFNGEEVFRSTFHAAISAQPYVRFFLSRAGGRRDRVHLDRRKGQKLVARQPRSKSAKLR